METRDRCPSREIDAGCQPSEDDRGVQPFPRTGQLAKNLCLPLPRLADRIGRMEGEAYSYVVSTVKWNDEAITFEQHGSAPNCQGGVLTLCTCKHRMRTTRAAADWQGVWLVGVTSRTIRDERHWLFFLAQVESAYESHADLWAGMRAGARRAKAAHLNYLGDLFQPKSPPPTSDDRFSPGRYISPRLHIHRWRGEDGRHEGWHNDIDYYLAPRLGHPPLLVADPRRTFIWPEPMIYYARDHCRDYHRWPSLRGLFENLRSTGL